MIDELIIEQAKTVDLINLAGKNTELHKESSTEWSGPCPRCGGHDRFHVKASGFFCRNRACWPDGSEKFGDSIAYVRWLHGVNFVDAINILTGGVNAPAPRRIAQPTTSAKPEEKRQHDGWAEKIEPMVIEAMERIETAESYLSGRNIELMTALVYNLGFRPDAPLPGTWDRHKREHTYQPQPAIVLPWYRGGRLVAVRYRFLQYHEYTDVDGKDRNVKQSSVYDSDFRGTLYGGQALPEFCGMPIDPNGRCAEQLRILILCEGEINAMSIWQATNGFKWDVLSVGSESQKLSDQARQFAERYERVIVWMDKKDAVRRVMSQLGNAVGISSPMINNKEHDANDLLMTGQLVEFLVEARWMACKSEDEKRRFGYNLEEVNYKGVASARG